MLNPNNTLPQNLQDLIKNMAQDLAVPISSENETALIAIKLDEKDETRLKNNDISCEFRPSIFNVNYENHTIALCIVQFRLNHSNQHIYTASYNLHDDRQFQDAYALLKMQDYNLLLSTENYHDFLGFTVHFEGKFKPQQIALGARQKASDYEPKLYFEVLHGLRSQAPTAYALWQMLESFAPFEYQWYASMNLNAEKEV